MKNNQETKSKLVLVMDTSAFVAGFDPFTISEEQVLAPLVENEVKSNPMTQLRLNMAVENGRVKIIEPSKESSDAVEDCAFSLGDLHFLSETDKQVLALALEIKERGDTPQIVTDDYAIQNVATKLDLKFVSIVTLGIHRLLSWIRYCPACHRTYSSKYKSNECQICGTKLKRKPKRILKSL